MAEEVSKIFGIFRVRARRPKSEIKDSPVPICFYEDERLRLEVPVPSIDVFLAFVRELDKLGAGEADVEKYVTTLARAFWVLHQQPRRRGLFRTRYEMPAVDEEEALTRLEREVKSVDVVLTSLPRALFGVVEYVMGGGAAGGEPRDREARLEP